MSQTKIAERLKKSQAWVSGVEGRLYSDVKWSDGEALRLLHAEVCGAAFGESTQLSEPA